MICLATLQLPILCKNLPSSEIDSNLDVAFVGIPLDIGASNYPGETFCSPMAQYRFMNPEFATHLCAEYWRQRNQISLAFFCPTILNKNSQNLHQNCLLWDLFVQQIAFSEATANHKLVCPPPIA